MGLTWACPVPLSTPPELFRIREKRRGDPVVIEKAMRPLVRAIGALSLFSSAALATACSGSDKHADSPASKNATLYNDPAPAGSADTQQAERQLVEMQSAQIRLSTVTAVAMRVGAALWLAQKSSCPKPDELVSAGLVSQHIRENDAWDKPYRIECGPKGPVVTSAGPDGAFGTSDDIVIGER
jgi:hypothetical protein